MFLIGQKTAETYGRLVSWDDDDGAFNMMTNGIGISPGEGIVVLEFQQRTLQFLVLCVETILHDLSLDDINAPILAPSPTLVSSNGDADGSPLLKSIVKAQYRVPDKFDFSLMQSFIYAKRDEAYDHLWSLREDPGYFKEVIWAWSEHRHEKVLTADGRSNPILQTPAFWERVLKIAVCDAYCSLLIWDQLCQQLAQLAQLREKYSRQIAPAERLPKEYDSALCHFSHFVDQACKGPLSHFTHGMVASPSLREHYERLPPEQNSTVINIQCKDSKRMDYLLWLLEQLVNEQQILLCGLHNLLDEIEQVIQSDSKQRERVST